MLLSALVLVPPESDGLENLLLPNPASTFADALDMCEEPTEEADHFRHVFRAGDDQDEERQPIAESGMR